MTNEVSVEDAIEVLKFMKRDVLEESKEDKVLDMAIQALEQQPSENCISREEAINELKLAYFNKDLQSAKDDPCIVDAMTDWAIRTIKNLPFVQPQPKKGKWIDIDATHSQCDKCLAVFEIASANGEANFCPNCGADMRSEGGIKNDK